MRLNATALMALCGMALSGCEGFWEDPPTTSDTGSTGDCLGGVEVASAGMTITNLQLDVATFNAVFNEGTTYDDYGYNACYNESSGEMSWIFEANGEPLGKLSAVVQAIGAQDMSSATNSRFTFTFYESGSNGSAVSFSNTQFTIGTWQVDSLDPLSMTIAGAQANTGSNLLEVTLSAEADIP